MAFKDPNDEQHQMGLWKSLIMVIAMAVLYQFVIPRLFPAVIAGRHTVGARGTGQHHQQQPQHRYEGGGGEGPVVEGLRSEARCNNNGDINEITIRGNMLASNGGMSRSRAKAETRKGNADGQQWA